MALEVEVERLGVSLVPDQRLEHADHLGTLLVDGGGVEVVDLLDAQKDEPVGGDVAQKGEEAAGAAAAAPPNNDAAWLLEDEGGASTAPAGGDAAQEDEPVGGDVAQKGGEDAGAGSPPDQGEPSKGDVSWLLDDGLDGDNSASTAPAGGDAAQEDEPVGGDDAQKGEEAAGTAAAAPPNNDAAWLLEDEGGASTAPAGGDVAQKREPVGGDAAQKGEAKLSPIERRLQKRRAKAKKAGDSTPGSSAQQGGSDSDAGAKGKRAKAEVAGPPKLFS